MINIIEEKNKNKLPIIFVYGAFNVIHQGHIRIFDFARNISGFLVFGLISQKIDSKIILSDAERLKNLNELNIADKCILIKIPLIDFLKELKPSYLIKGKEHENDIDSENEKNSRSK